MAGNSDRASASSARPDTPRPDTPRPDTRRRDNLAAVLRLLHEGRAATRAELTRHTGLNRSTIAALVAELEQRGLVIEGDPETTSRVGRPSPSVALHPGPVALAINPELDAVVLATVRLGARVERRIRVAVDHPVSPDEVAAITADALPEFELTGRRLVGVGVALPGLVRAADSLVRWAPHLGWTDAALAPRIANAVGAPVSIANDASLGALAESRFGAGRDVPELVYLNGGASGIGGGIVVGGAPLGGMAGFAGEFGHTRTGLADPADRVTAAGMLEDEVSRARLLRLLGAADADEREFDRLLLARVGTEAPLAAEVARQRRVLAAAIGTATAVLDPELVVLGGFLATILRADAAELERLVRAASVPLLTERVRIRPAELGADRLLIGAAELAFARLLDDPAS